ncbi:uncharacterized protein [Venturia canescens]|uniref:uncharacterized protein n=1 Tax=Venturia canescens TaxID=32260 RepID=UPI001C9C8AB6|nr:uncharacterized protein LOC122407613 [Venturia canescens]
MIKLSVLLVIVTVIAVVHGWYETKRSITSDTCVRSIHWIKYSFDPTKHFFNHISRKQKSLTNSDVQKTLGEIKNCMRNELSALIATAEQIQPVKMYYHEIREFFFSDELIACPQEIAYKVARICYSSFEEVTAFAINYGNHQRHPELGKSNYSVENFCMTIKTFV